MADTLALSLNNLKVHAEISNPALKVYLYVLETSLYADEPSVRLSHRDIRRALSLTRKETVDAVDELIAHGCCSVDRFALDRMRFTPVF